MRLHLPRATLALTLGIPAAAAPLDLGDHAAFRRKTVRVPPVQGRNHLKITPGNTRGGNHGGWSFAFKATPPDGAVPWPKAE